MSKVAGRSRWGYHAFFPCAILVCLAAGWFELGRARSGHEIAWVYTFEWPVFAAVFAFMWWHLMTERSVRRPGPPRAHGEKGSIPDDDPGLLAWQRYLEELGHDETNTDRAPGSG